MSGAIALEAALTNPSRVIGIVGVDNFTGFGGTLSPELKAEIAAAYKALRTHYKQTAVEYANQSLFAPSTDSAIRKRVINDFINVDSVIATNCLETSDSYPIDAKLKTLHKTLYTINSDRSHTDTLSFKKGNIAYHLLNVGPTGHYPMIEKPTEFNTLLEQAIRSIGGK